MLNCKDCKYFERAKWHPCIDPDQSDQLGGHCPLLFKALGLSNAYLLLQERMHVQESFGCVLGRRKED